ncbi:two-component system OmpR family response regulator [Clostridiales Family XIII bacterium PM5-7]
MEKNRILIVDDDPNIREVLSVLLGSEGYVVEQAEDGEIALEKINNLKDIDLVILDIMMPGLSGVEVCANIRKISLVPVLFLTAKSQDQDKVDAYTEGGDDYLVKPFSQTELLMKVKSLLRRYKEYPTKGIVRTSEVIIGGNIQIDRKTRAAIKAGRRIGLTDKEYDILQFFMDHKGEIVENKELYEGVWGEKYLPSAGNTIMVHVLNLRKKLEEDVNNPKIIKTVWGKGYKVE